MKHCTKHLIGENSDTKHSLVMLKDENFIDLLGNEKIVDK